MESQKISNIFSIVLSSLVILSAVSVFLGHLCTNLLGTGFFAYLLNIFSAPILMIFPVLVNLFGGLWVIYVIVSLFFIIGLVNLALSIRELKSDINEYPPFVVSYVCSCLAMLLCGIILYSLCVNGFKLLSDSSVWSVFWLILFLIGIIWSFVLKTILLVRLNKRSSIVIK